MHNIAIILAGGTGSRVGGTKPKQFLPLQDGRSILEHSVDAFEKADFIEEICIVIHPDYIADAQALREKNDWQKVRAIIPGGDQRWKSSYNAIMYYTKRLAFTLNHQFNEDRPYPDLPTFSEASDINLWFHDAARPFVSQRILSDINRQIKQSLAVTVAVPATDTMYFVKPDEQEGSAPKLEMVLDRNCIMHAQTPQVFRMDEIARAYVSYAVSQYPQFVPTDDVNMFINTRVSAAVIRIVQGDETNRKITYSTDLDIPS